MKNVNFVSRDVQRILSSNKISEKYNEQEVFYKKTVIKNFAIFTGNTCVGVSCFNKNAGLQVCNFIKTRLQHSCFLDNAVKFLNTGILKNVCERLLLRVFLFMLV